METGGRSSAPWGRERFKDVCCINNATGEGGRTAEQEAFRKREDEGEEGIERGWKRRRWGERESGMLWGVKKKKKATKKPRAVCIDPELSLIRFKALRFVEPHWRDESLYTGSQSLSTPVHQPLANLRGFLERFSILLLPWTTLMRNKTIVGRKVKTGGWKTRKRSVKRKMNVYY